MFYDNAWSIQQKCRMGGTDMCVGLSAKVVKISDGTAVVDAGGAKREVSAQLLGDLEPGDYVMVQVLPLQRSPMMTRKRQTS